MAIVKTTILDDDDSIRTREILGFAKGHSGQALLSIETDKLTLVISSDDWNSWVATLPPSGASVSVKVEDPRSGALVHTIADIRWPTWWPRD